MAANKTYKFTICGLLKDVTFHMAKCCAEDLHLKLPEIYLKPEIRGMLEFEWDMYIEAKIKELRGETWIFKDNAVTFANDEMIGGPQAFLNYAEAEHNYSNFRPHTLYDVLAEEAYKSYLNTRNHEYVYMDIEIEGKAVGRLLIELFTDSVPKTCDNFKKLCTGEKGESPHTEYKLHYEGSIFHRIVKNGWIQGGDIFMKRGDGGESVFGPVFEDENFAISHEQRGILGMANKGRHTNGSQFYITLQPAKWMDTKYVAFGKIIEGTQTLKAMEEQNTMNERPLKEMKIVSCGISTYSF